MKVFDRARRDRTELDELHGRLARLQADVSRIETEWADTKDQVRRSYQRLEKAAQRAEKAQTPCDEDAPPDERELELLDPYSRKMAEVRSQSALRRNSSAS